MIGGQSCDCDWCAGVEDEQRRWSTTTFGALLTWWWEKLAHNLAVAGGLSAVARRVNEFDRTVDVRFFEQTT